ncbi:hypothetical protein, partial [Mycobacterium asiaticum]|uniref:hypothetical protein n=1 Tax=Mycobacterium asiaticum TaxID=1790 RepID=UPI000A817CE5
PPRPQFCSRQPWPPTPHSTSSCSPAADDNPLLFLVQLGALMLTPGIFAGLLGLASTLLATYWAVQLFSAVFSG